MKLYQLLEDKKYIEYYRIYNWLIGNKSNIKLLENYCGRIDEFIENSEYVLYTGLYVHEDKRCKHVGILSEIQKTLKYSTSKFIWYKDIGTARSKIYENKDDKGFGIILKNTFKPQEVIIDIEFIDENNDYFKNLALFEDEVIVKPKQDVEFQVIEIIK